MDKNCPQTENGRIVPQFIFQGQLVAYFTFKNQLQVAFWDQDGQWKILKKPVWQTLKTQSIKIISLKATTQAILLKCQVGKTQKNLRFSLKNPTQLLGEKPRLSQKDLNAFLLKKHQYNPILKPIESHFWESKATFNPAALLQDDKVHLLYRAIGDNDVSVLGYACSHDGLNINLRSGKPAFVPQHTLRETPGGFFSPYMSGGGGFGGCEDPRLTKIKNRIYMTYVAYDGWGPPRVALTSIDLNDFLGQKWDWQKPVLISKPGQVDKNACILPEKIKGKYVVFHRVFPHILIDLVESLDFDGQTFLQGEYRISPRQNSWDSRKVGVGPTPIKTQDGWLTIYHAVDNKDDRKYKMGAMLLDLNAPTKVLRRTNQPILEPTECYENEGHKFGVAYPCGAVCKNDQLMVYYGGADMVSCVATAPMNQFLDQLKNKKKTQLHFYD